MPQYLKSDPESVFGRYDRLLSAQANWRSLWQELSEFIIPRKSTIIQEKAPGQRRTAPYLYDSTAPDANSVLAASIHGSLTSPTSRWFSLRYALQELNEDPEAMGWLEAATDKLFLKIQQSNFDSEIQEVYAEASALGTGAILVDEMLSPDTDISQGGVNFIFESVPIGTYVISENQRRVVDTLMRVVSMPIHAAAEEFGEAMLSDDARSKLESRPDEMIKLLHAVFPRGYVAKKAPPMTSPEKLPYASIWIEMDKKSLLREGGYHEFPFSVVRWTKQTGELYGRGPGELSLPNIRSLNEGVKYRLQGWGLAIKPPLAARDRGVIGKVVWQPAAVNYVREMENIAPIQTGAQFDVANFNEKDFRDAIRATFFNNQLQLPDKSIITATEANQRVRMMHRVLGPTLGRLDYELLRRMIDRLFAMALRAGEFGQPPAIVLRAARNNIANIEVSFDGPLARAQRAADLEAAAEFVNSVLPLAPVFPDIGDNIDSDAYVRRAAQWTSMPSDLLRSKKAIKAIREAKLAAAQQAEQIAQATEIAKAAGAAAPAVEAMRGNALDTEVSAGSFEPEGTEF